MSIEQEQKRLQLATESLERIKVDCKTKMDDLQARLKAAPYEGQKAEIQRDIDKLKLVFDRAIDRAQIERAKAEAEYLVQKSVRDAAITNQRAAREAEIKNHALREWVNAGGDPAQFEAAWTNISQTVLTERVVSALIGQQKSDEKPDTMIRL